MPPLVKLRAAFPHVAKGIEGMIKTIAAAKIIVPRIIFNHLFM